MEQPKPKVEITDLPETQTLGEDQIEGVAGGLGMPALDAAATTTPDHFTVKLTNAN